MKSSNVNPYEYEALEALAIAIIKEPDRKQEFEKNALSWIEAYTFYREEGIDPYRIESQLRGIDFNCGIKISLIPPPNKVIQYQPPTIEGQFPQRVWGNYWAVPGHAPQELGISDYGKLRDTNEPWKATQETTMNVKKTPLLFEVNQNNTQKVRALFSTAARVIDTWSRRQSWDPMAHVVMVLCKGGGEQIFSPKAKTILQLIPNQKPIQSFIDENKLLRNIYRTRNYK